MNVGQKLGPLKDLKVKRVPFFKGKTTLFGEKGPPKAPLLKKIWNLMNWIIK